MIRKIFLSLWLALPLFAEGGYSITEFQLKNATRGTYFFGIEVPINRAKTFQKIKKCEEMNIPLTFRVNSNYLFPVGCSSVFSEGLLTMRLYTENPFTEKGRLIVTDGSNTTLASIEFTPGNLNQKKDTQPNISQIHPSGGTPGSTITIYGENLGDNVDKIGIVFLDPHPYENEPYKEKEITFTTPFFLGTTGKESKEFAGKKEDLIKFTLPLKLPEEIERAGIEINSIEKLLGKRIHMYLLIGGRPTEMKSIRLLGIHWKWVNALVSVGIAFLFLLIPVGIVKKWNLLPLILIDSKTNTYSLSHLQSFLWTIVLLGCYFYVASARFLLLQDWQLPEFHLSLTGLLAISYGGYIASNLTDSKNAGQKLKRQTPELFDLIGNSDGKIDISKLQLLGFTLVGVIVYLILLLAGDPLLGLPEIPSTFQALMLGSQAGFVGSRVTNAKISISYLSPRELDHIEKETTFTIIGTGFREGIRATLEGEKPGKLELIGPNEIKLTLSPPKEPGEKNLIFLPPEGEPVEIKNAILYQEQKVEVTEQPGKTNQ